MRVPSAGTRQDGAAGTAPPAPRRDARPGQGRGSVSREVEPCLRSPVPDPSLERKSRGNSLETSWINLEACFAHNITAERAAGTTVDAGPHIPTGLCSCGDKSWHISGRCQQLWEGDHHRVGSPWGAETWSPFLRVCGCRLTRLLQLPGEHWDFWLANLAFLAHFPGCSL